MEPHRVDLERCTRKPLLPTHHAAPTVVRWQLRETVMWAQITHRWADGSEVELEVGDHEPGYPQAVSEMVARVLDMYRVVCCDEAGE